MIGRHRKAYRVRKQIAREEKVSVDTVMNEIDASIREAYAQACISGGVEVLKRWRRIPCSGELPNALEFLEYMGEKLRNDM